MLPLVRPLAHADFTSEAQRHLEALRVVVEEGGVVVGEHFEKRQLWKTSKHKRALVGASLQFSKCAWCERYCEWKRELDVEHYRPKVEVTRWEGSPPLVSDQPPKEIPVSGGYWWLAFEWENYTLACGPCNQGWKRNLFPVRGDREPHGVGMESSELPLLVNPMSTFRIGDHFSWTELGVMNAESAEGEATIITCGLNRSLLVAPRSKVAHNVLDEIQTLERALGSSDRALRHLQKLRELCDPKSEFAGMNRWWVEQTLGWTWDVLERATATP